MKQIILLRHAKVDVANSTPMGSHDLQGWVYEYDYGSIDEKNLPDEETIALANSADVALTSTLRRAKDSAKVLGVSVHEESALFNEALIPEANIPLLKLKPKTWLVILRVMLLLGLGKKDTSLKTSKEQAKKAAEKLLLYTKENEKVLLVGHGGMNWLIRKRLEQLGWKLQGKSSNKHWGVTILSSI
jgi:phosphohistidine phosphatase SixA